MAGQKKDGFLSNPLLFDFFSFQPVTVNQNKEFHLGIGREQQVLFSSLYSKVPIIRTGTYYRNFRACLFLKSKVNKLPI